jgi:hypothetical protein
MVNGNDQSAGLSGDSLQFGDGAQLRSVRPEMLKSIGTHARFEFRVFEWQGSQISLHQDYIGQSSAA